MVTALQLAWAAGFIEGEGYFCSRGVVTLAVSQVQREPVERLQRIFGGHLRLYPNSRHGQPVWRWTVNGLHAAAVTMTLYGMLSPRRKEQAAKLLALWRSRKGRRNKLNPNPWARVDQPGLFVVGGGH